MNAALFNTFIQSLREGIGTDSILIDSAECVAYSYDNSRHKGIPLAVVLPHTHEQVETIIQCCNQYCIPVFPRGRGTATTGAAVPTTPGIVLSLERMKQIIEINPNNRVMVVEPGITNQEVQNALQKYGFFWPPDPTSAAYCSIGGNIACNSAGPHSLKYGTTRDNTLGLRAITGEGKSIKTGVYTTKGVVGYDLTSLLVGSEGTLAVITQATLQLTPLPETKATISAIYADIKSATQAISHMMAQPITPSALEFMDSQAIAMIRDYSKANLPTQAGALLIIEIDGLTNAIEEATNKIMTAAKNEGLIQIQKATTQEEIKALWATRKALSPALRRVAPKKINEDVVVPVEKIPEFIMRLNELAKQYQITIVNFGHAGNGNIHVNLLTDPDNHEQQTRAAQCLDHIFDLVLQLNGTLSGEHGVGLEKQPFITKEIGHNELDLMRNIKKQFDPNNILNPGKVFPALLKG